MDRQDHLEILNYLIRQIEVIQKYTEGLDEELFLRDDLVKDASLMRLLVLGEYSSKLEDDLKDRFSEVQWQMIRAARNYYAHAYKGVDWRLVWETIDGDLPGLKQRFEHIIEVLEGENNGKAD